MSQSKNSIRRICSSLICYFYRKLMLIGPFRVLREWKIGASQRRGTRWDEIMDWLNNYVAVDNQPSKRPTDDEHNVVFLCFNLAYVQTTYSAMDTHIGVRYHPPPDTHSVLHCCYISSWLTTNTQRDWNPVRRCSINIVLLDVVCTMINLLRGVDFAIGGLCGWSSSGALTSSNHKDILKWDSKILAEFFKSSSTN